MDSEAQPTVDAQGERPKIEIQETLVKNCHGTVKWYSHKLLYGFISRKDNNEDVFVHRTAISISTMKTPNLRNGEEVEFSVVRTSNGVEAYEVTGPDGAPVQGFQLRHRRRGRRNGAISQVNGDGSVGEADDTKKDGDDETGNGVTRGAEAGQRRPRRRVRRGGRPGPQNGDGGQQSEGEVFYEPNEYSSPPAGQQRRQPSGRRGSRRGMRAYRGTGRGGVFRGKRGAANGSSPQATAVEA